VIPRDRLDPELTDAVKLVPFGDLSAELLPPLRVRFEMPLSDASA
jgi:hypothetical protein